MRAINTVIVSLLAALICATSIAQEKKVYIERAEKEELDLQIEEFKKLPQWKQNQLKEQSKAEVAKGEAAYNNKDFEAALKHYGKALDLDPTSNTAQYRQAVTAYKQGDLKWAIAYLKLTESEEVSESEKQFLLGMSYYKLKDFENALKHFDSVKSTGDTDLAPNAAFYKGFYNFQQKNYAVAKSEFEYVLDTSKSPELDEKAERYIELMIRLQQSKETKSKKWFFNGMIGVQYDSNILFNPESAIDQGVATNNGGARLLTVGSAKYRAINKTSHELAVQTNLVYMLSFDSDFRRADPFLASIDVPYSYKGKLFGKNYRLDFTPGFETLYLDADNNQERENILNTPKVAVNNTFVMSKTWFSNYSFVFRAEDSKIAVLDPADEATAKKYEFSTNQTWILNPKKQKIVGGTLKYYNNAADGDNNDYSRFDISALYTQKLPWWNLSWANTLTYYRLKYTKRTDERLDNNIAFNLTFSKPVKKWLTMILTGGYVDNSSNVDANTYDKYTVMLGASANYSL